MRAENDYLICKYDNCGKFFEQPINLPCGETICSIHMTDSNNKHILECKLCNQHHIIPKDGFAINRSVLKIINLNIHLKDKHKLVKKELEKLESFIIENDNSSLTDADNYLYEYFSNVRNQIDLHRETIIKEISDISDRIIDKLKKYEKECKNNKGQVMNKFDFDDLKSNLILKWKEELRLPNIQTDKLNNILVEMKSKKFEIESHIVQYKKNLLMNKDYEFIPIELNEKIFGELLVNEYSNNNTLIQNNNILLNEYGKCVINFKGHSNSVTVIIVLKQFNYLVSGSSDSLIKIWSISTGECLVTLKGHSKLIRDLLVTSNNYLISCSLDKIILWDLNSQSSHLPIASLKNTISNCLSLINNLEFACGSVNGNLSIINILDLNIIRARKVHKERINNIKLILNSRLLTCSSDKEIKMIDIETLNVLRSFDDHIESVNCLELALGNYFLSGSDDGTIKLWSLSADQNNANCILTIPMQNACINDVKLIGLNTLAIAIKNNTNNLFIYDYAKNVLTKELKGHDRFVLRLDYLNETNRLFSCSADSTIKMWDV